MLNGCRGLEEDHKKVVVSSSYSVTLLRGESGLPKKETKLSNFQGQKGFLCAIKEYPGLLTLYETAQT